MQSVQSIVIVYGKMEGKLAWNGDEDIIVNYVNSVNKNMVDVNIYFDIENN